MPISSEFGAAYKFCPSRTITAYKFYLLCIAQIDFDKPIAAVKFEINT